MARDQFFDRRHLEVSGLRQRIQASDRIIEPTPTSNVEGCALRARHRETVESLNLVLEQELISRHHAVR
jgi:hypothetical protein